MASRPIQILIVGAHPADTFDQAGGTLAHHAAQGDKITAATLTTGARSHHFKNVDRKRCTEEKFDVEAVIEQAAEEKLEETRRACRILGFDDVRTLGFEDDDILLTKEMVEKVADLIRDVRPNLIITHHPFESLGGLTMHSVTGKAVIYAYQQAQGVGRGTKKSFETTSIYFMNPMNSVDVHTLSKVSTSVTISIDVTDVIEKKVRAMDEIASQHYSGAYSRKCQETMEGRFGAPASVAYAEQFQALWPRVAYTLPVSDAEVARSNERVETLIARRSEIVAATMPLADGEEYTSSCRFTKEMYDI